MPLNLPRLRRRAYDVAVRLRADWYRGFWGMQIGEGVKLSGSLQLDKTNPRGVHIGDYTALAFDVAVLTHDFVGNRHLQTRIGSHCFIGARSVVLAGVSIGDHCVVAAGSVVMADVPPHSLVAGNPAKVVRGGIVTGRWGIMDKRFLDLETSLGRPRALAPQPALPGIGGLPALDRQTIVRLFRQEAPDFDETWLDRPLADLGIDSFGLINLRVALEAASGRTIGDGAWAAVSAPSDLIGTAGAGDALPAHQPPGVAPQEPGGPPAPRENLPPRASPAGEARAYYINMPQMALRGLSEAWLMKEIGDLHWSILMRELRANSAALADSEGSRLYATFTRIRFQSDSPLTSFRENERIELSMTEQRYGAAMFFGSAALRGVRGSAHIDVMTTFSKYGEAGANTSLLKGQPVIPADCTIPTMPDLPEIGQEYRKLRASHPEPVLEETEYDLQPAHDINGVGLLYFAAYPTIAELCLTRLKGPEFAFGMSVRERDICYFANADPSETLLFRLHHYEDDGAGVSYRATVARKSDGVRMALISCRKERVTLPPPGRPVLPEEQMASL